ncbi:MBG domain-containing protein [Erythrobacter sp. W302b]|uniref:MBG domain-containing protein n=1 Tax=Erythrobacter sp. W302b TaxID=3389874 RepID=UPI00396B3C48
MTRANRSRHPHARRSQLMLGCGSAALALALLLPTRAEAQGILADGAVVFGAANIEDSGPTSTTVDLFTPTVVINWTPNVDNAGNALDFLRTDASALFRNFQTPNFAVLNRILPTANGNVVTINGTVLSRFFDPNNGGTPAGTVAFYSPTGILIGGTATFDVGSLLLTTLDIQPGDFEAFGQGGIATLTGAAGSTARVQINPGAQILATPENAFFAVVAADIEMLGTARINGSHAYVAGEVVNLGFSNGLFNIVVPVGTAASGEVVTVNGNVGGPSSTGAGDNHMIYGVARAGADPISMLFSGNLGFEPAQGVSIVNGEIILSANYNVSGRDVDGNTISNGIAATFNGNAALSDVRADIFIDDFLASSSVLAIGTHRVQATSFDIASSVAGNLLLVGRENAELIAQNGQGFTVTGDVLVDARDYGESGAILTSLDAINAQGGSSLILAGVGSDVTISGSALVTADALGGFDAGNLTAGSAIAGSALVSAAGGTIRIQRDATIKARGLGTPTAGAGVGAEARGGLAQLAATQGGSVDVTQKLNLFAEAIAAEGSLVGPSTVSNAYGGQALMTVAAGGGTLTIGGDVEANANARGGSSNSAGAGSIGDAGTAAATINGPGLITITGRMQLDAQGFGGANGSGIGGVGLGGRASATTFTGGTIAIGGTIDASFRADARGVGGAGQTGGGGSGGIAGATAEIGTVTILGRAQATSDGVGGNATLGLGGNGGIGRGGRAVFQATGTLTQNATLTIGGNVAVFAQGAGGIGGPTDGAAIAAGRGGDGIGGDGAAPNQADPTVTNGAFLLAGGDRGNLSVTGSAQLSANGTGGRGGAAAGLINGGRGGDGFGGRAQTGLELFGLDGSVGQGTATVGNVVALANGTGGIGGGADFGFATGSGGNGTGGSAALTVRAGDITANQITLEAAGRGGEGRVGGSGTGGAAQATGSLGGAVSLAQFNASATGVGGNSGFSAGGAGLGGEAAVELQGISVTVSGNTTVEANGGGGFALTGNAGNGTGGTAYIAVTNGTQGSGTFSGNTAILANGLGGAPDEGGIGGTGRGGTAFAQSQAASVVRFGSLQVTASGRGGESEADQAAYVGGAGFGGSAELRSLGTGSSLIVERNFDSITFADALNEGAIVAALGIGGITSGGTGIGGAGNGGTIVLRAAQGGAMALPANPNTDPGSGGFNRLLARGVGGGSLVEGGTGGAASGGAGLIEVDGGTMTMGETLFSVFGEGGSSLLAGSNISGGNARGGTRQIRVLNGGTATLELLGGVAGGVGGNGSGTGVGGDGFGGRSTLEVLGATLNLVGRTVVVDQATGGTGRIGGNAFESGDDGLVSFTANEATINFLPNASGQSGLSVGGTNQGGAGGVAGGNARATPASITITNSTVTGGNFEFLATAAGGAGIGPGGSGGNAVAANMTVAITGSDIGLSGQNVIAIDALGGAGATNGTGGTATSASADVVVTGSTLNIATSAVGLPGVLRVRSLANGGAGSTTGNAASGRALLNLADSTLNVGQVFIEARAFAEAANAGQTGGIANGGSTRLEYGGATEVTTNLISISSNAQTSSGGSAAAGSTLLQGGAGSQAVINTAVLTMSADASGGSPGLQANGAGRFLVDLGGGNVNAGTMLVTALGDAIIGDPPASQVVAQGGNLNVAGQLDISAYDSIQIITGAGSIIGSQPVAATTTAITVTSRGTIAITDDNSGSVSLGGQSISLNAGRSILLDGNLAVRDGAVDVLANVAGTLPPPPGAAGPAVITMAQGSSINAGTGSATLRLFDGGGLPELESGTITLANITAGQIDARNFGTTPGSDIVVIGSGVLTASGTGRAIDLAALNGEVINLNGDAGLILTGGGHYGIFAATPAGSQIGSFANYARRYSIANAAAYDALNPGGNFAAFRIVPVLTVTANDLTRFYGSTDLALTASITGFLPGDDVANLSGAPLLTTAANSTSNVGQFAINAAQGSLLSAQGYQFTFNPGQLTIAPRPITVTANNLSRVYGNANPALTFTVGDLGLVNGDQLTGALATAADVTTPVGTFAITQGTLVASSNYALTFVDGQLTITPRGLTITADSLSRVYGDANPALTFTLGGAGLVNGDQLIGALATTADVTTGIGNVAITQGTLTAGANYAVSFTNGQLTITPRPISVTADSIARIYGNANPALTFTVGGAGLVNGDQLTGALATTADVTTGVGNVAITQGTLAAGANYSVSFTNGQLTITPRPISVTADSISRIYGNANPALTFTVGGAGLVNGDQLTGALATTADVTTGIGNVAITQGTLGVSSNYSLNFIGGQLTITPRPITITADNVTRIYGNANPALTFTLGGAGLVNGDQLTGALATTAGVTTGVGNVAITQGTLTAGANYAVSFTNGQLTITPRPIIIRADDKDKLLGEPDPVFTFTIGGDGLVNEDRLTGSLARDPGETRGIFVIRQGTLVAGPNYVTTFEPGALTIIVPPTPLALNNPTLLEPLNIIGEPLPAFSDEEEDARFGIDFLQRADAALISEDEMLDEPVTSGGDASLYGGGQTPPTGGQ